MESWWNRNTVHQSSTRPIAAQLPPAPTGQWKPPAPNKPKTQDNNKQKETGLQSQKGNVYIWEGKKNNCTEAFDTSNLGCKSGSKHTQSMPCEEWERLGWNQAKCSDKKREQELWTTQSCVAFRRRIAFASTAMHTLKASFHLPVNGLVKLFPMLPWIPGLKSMCLAISFFWHAQPESPPSRLPALAQQLCAFEVLGLGKGGKIWPLK